MIIGKGFRMEARVVIWFLVPLAILIFAWLWPLLWYAAVQGRVECTIASERRECEAGEGVPVEIDVINRSFVPLPFVEVRVRLPEGLSFHPSVQRPDLCVITRVWIKSRARIRVQVYGVRRGPQILSDVSVVGHEGFGLAIRPLARASNAVWLAIRPARRASHAHLPFRMLQGLRAAPRALVADETWVRGVRPYQYGDPVRHIDWRATARLGDLVVKQFFPTAQRQFLVILNAQVSEPHWLRYHREAFEALCDELSAWADRLHRGGAEVLFATNASVSLRRLKSAPDRITPSALRSLLAHAHPYAAYGLEVLLLPVLRAPDAYPGELILFSSWESARQAAVLRQLERMGKAVHVVRPKLREDGGESDGHHDLLHRI